MIPDSATADCPHGRRAGITTCLYCKQEERDAARQRRNRFLARAGLVTVGGGVLISLTVGALVAVAPRRAPNATVAAADTASKRVIKVVPKGSAKKHVEPATPVVNVTISTPEIPKPSAENAGPTNDVTQAGAVLPPAIPGSARTDLGEGVYAENSEGEVIVHFDTDELRTRFDEKFERTVRKTLPVVLGDDGRAALDSVQAGALVRGGNLLTDLPLRGIALALPGGRTLTVYPVTRAGQDGPLVIAYRAVLR